MISTAHDSFWIGAFAAPLLLYLTFVALPLKRIGASGLSEPELFHTDSVDLESLIPKPRVGVALDGRPGNFW
jgi:hypothetical protein